MAQTAREYLFSLGLTKSPTGRGRFSNEAKAALAKAESEGIKFVDVTPSVAQPVIDVNAKDVRRWANENGYSLGDRGRISGTIKQAYLDATSPEDRQAPEVKANGINEYAQAHWRHPIDTDFTGKDSNGKVHTVSGRNACDCGYSLVGHVCDNPTALVCTKSGMERIKVIPVGI